jgi:hypothetical protein
MKAHYPDGIKIERLRQRLRDPVREPRTTHGIHEYNKEFSGGIGRIALVLLQRDLTEYQGLNVLGRSALQIRHKNMLRRKGVSSLFILDDAVAAYRIIRADERKPPGLAFEVDDRAYQHVHEYFPRAHVGEVSEWFASLKMFAIPHIGLNFLQCYGEALKALDGIFHVSA